jgi:tripartite-type tricarboxylate transporter receptor subunit TctC
VPQVQKVTYGPRKDFAPVSIFGTGPFILGISSSIPAKTLAEFVTYAIHQDQLRVQWRRLRRPSRRCAVVAARVWTPMHVPFRGGERVTAALLGGQIDMFSAMHRTLFPRLRRQGEDPRCRYAAADEATSERPTISETSGMSLTSWNGFLVPAKTPREIIDKLAKHVTAAARDPAMPRN